MKRKRDTKSGAGKIVRGALFVVFLILLLGSCEQMFTFSPLSWAQRDPAKLSDAQKIAYAESVLGSGDADAMADAYNAIKDSSDPDVQYLASQLALGASGINEASEEILASIDTIDSATLKSILDGVDDTFLGYSVDSMDAAILDSTTKEDISSEDYFVTAAAILLSYEDPALPGNPIDVTASATYTSLDSAFATADTTSTDPYEKAAGYLIEAGYTDSTDLENLLNFGS